MRAGVGAIQHTLTPAANAVLKDAFGEAKTRGHSQVQPLHVAAILLIQSDSDSPLRRACLESHKDPSHPLQCRALELCFKVALDRLPSNQEKSSMPQLSNALVAALKRAQAHQRRGTPEQSLQPLLAVKVEIDQLIISILDDPSVSRVMREAGFSSTDVKSNMEETAAAAAQQSTSLTCSASSLDTSGQLRRGDRLPVAPFGSSPHESGQFRHSLFSSASPLMFEPPGGNLRMGHRGLLSNVAETKAEKESSLLSGFHHQDAVGRSFTPISPFAEKSPLFLNRMEQSRLHPQPPVSLNRGVVRSTGFEEDVRNVVETLAKKKNAVLLNDRGSPNSNLVVKEFSQRLKSGEVPPFLKGVHLINLPFSSLTVGLFSHEEMEQKLTELRNLVEGSIAQGVILSLGDLQWLAESVHGKATVTHAHARLVIRELTQFLDVYSSQRFWLLATASPEIFMTCKVGDPPIESRLNLQSIQLAAASGVGLGFQSRHGGSHQIRPDVRSTPLDREEAATQPVTQIKLPGIEDSVDGLGCCPDCTSKCQTEVSRLLRQDRPREPGFAASPASTSPWMGQPGDMNWPPLAAVKDEGVVRSNPLLSQRLRLIRENWQRVCAAHSSRPGGLLTVVDPVRSIHSSIQTPESFLSQGKGRPLMSIPRWSEPSRFLAPNLAEQPSVLPSKVRSLPPLAMNPSPVSSLSNGEATSAYRSPDVSSAPVAGWMKMTESSGGLDSSRFSSSQLVATSKADRDTMGADLALGRSSIEMPLRPTRDLREEGQQPLQVDTKLSIADNSRSEPVPEVALPWLVSSLSGTDFLKAGLQKGPTGNIFRPNDMDSLKGLWRGLQDMVPWQKDASSAVASTVSDCRSGNGRKRGSAVKTDTWLLFLGPDRVGKREVAKSLAKLVFGDEKKLITMQLGGNALDATSLGSGVRSGIRQRGKTVLDRLADAVRQKPFSVVLLEDVDQADSVVRGSLQRTMERGRLPSSNGREVSFANVIVIMTCNVGGRLLYPKRHFNEKDDLAFEEEQLSGLPSYGMKVKVDDTKCGRVLQENRSGVSVVSYGLDLRISLERSSSPPGSFKRKADWTLQNGGNGSPLREKRPKREGSVSSKALALDLNLSAEENECLDDLSCTTDSNTTDRSADQETEEVLAKKVISLARESLPKDIFELADARVIFRPFDFTTLVDGVLEQLGTTLRSVLITGITMEVDIPVLEQLVSAAWHTNSDRQIFHSWVNDVLLKTLCSLSADCGPSSVVKLMTDPGQALEVMQDAAVVRVGLLPASIKCL
ncbi:hypothetical protein R1sor_006278 [Riccia sorocarpa]|uniref:Clp R domain-containing protein n=1 Tax=Riccia sorocarpa TaxID=122646 RepID=A0ABD3HM50_9MARC